jgi:5-methylcytosine-specific restriction enzyme A
MPEDALLRAEALIRIANSLTPRQREILALLCDAPRNELSAGELAHKMRLAHHGAVILEAVNLAKRLTEMSGVGPPKREDGSTRWWLVPFTGRYSRENRDRGFLWRLRPELRDAAIECRLVDETSVNLYPEVATGPLVEGSTTAVLVNAYERSRPARQRCVEHYGAFCAVCNLNFAERYGPIADGVIHVHHIRPISTIGSRYEIDPIEDLRPVCANCHVVIHRRDPPFSIREVRAFLRENHAAEATH